MVLLCKWFVVWAVLVCIAGAAHLGQARDDTFDTNTRPLPIELKENP